MSVNLGGFIFREIFRFPHQGPHNPGNLKIFSRSFCNFIYLFIFLVEGTGGRWTDRSYRDFDLCCFESWERSSG